MQRLISIGLFLVCAQLFIACGGNDEGTTNTTDMSNDAGASNSSDTGTASNDTGIVSNDTETNDVGLDIASNDAAPDTDTSTPGPSIGEVLDCGRAGPAGGLSRGDELQRHDLDLSLFPDAVCNDGTGAVFYFRPYEGAENRDRWVIQLQGGGSCRDGKLCAERWCSINTNFGMQQMTAELAPEDGTRGRGILTRSAENPVGNANHVFVRYCSSDAWSGTGDKVDIDTVHPVTGDPAQFQLSFQGAHIIDAVLATLRQSGASPLNYTLDTSNTDLPDLDEAEFVLFAGASAGGAGIINNVDRVGAMLREENIHCDANNCPLEYRALIDSAFSPSIESLEFTNTPFCQTGGLCDYTSYAMAIDELGKNLWQSNLDTSCLDYHADTEDTWHCADTVHLLQHHLTEPFFVRMGQTDSLISSGFIDNQFASMGSDLDLLMFASLIRAQLTALGTIQATAHEGDAITTAPGWFGPTCEKHETLRHDASIFDVKIRDENQGYSMFDVMENWLTQSAPSGLVASSPADNVCP